MSKKFKIRHDRDGCIGCTSCANICPRFWQMNEQDGLADLQDAKRLTSGDTELTISEEDFEDNMEAAESCPVNVIHLVDIGSGNELI
ncbi:ferredoxin [Patescibacteria group bacterium]|nr:ferredoxin [Patescibacteria group bacterium]